MGLIEKAEWEASHPENLFPFTLFVLGRLKKNGIKIAVLSRNSGKSVCRVFPNLDQYADAFLPRESVLRPKPDPEHLRQAMNLLNVLPQKTVMVGDHPIDVLSGKKAGTFTIGVLSGRIEEREIKAVGADLIVPDISYLIGLLEE